VKNLGNKELSADDIVKKFINTTNSIAKRVYRLYRQQKSEKRCLECLAKNLLSFIR